MSPTLELYASLERAFAHFNEHLFKGELPPCLITLRSSNKIYGYHHSARFINLQGQTVDELGLHPGHFTLRSIESVLSTLVHEMVHHWQHHFGTPSRTNPHNAQWVQKMRSIGLNPSNTGLPGGKTTGHRVSHYIEPDGLFMQACKSLTDSGFELKWFDRQLPAEPDHEINLQTRLADAGITVPVSPRPIEVLADLQASEASAVEKPPIPPSSRPPAKKRLRFECDGCGTRVWATSDIAMMCIPCGKALRDTSA